MRNRKTNEKEPLLKSTKKKPSKALAVLANTTKFGLGVGGAGGGIAFYIGPADYCSKTAGCGQEVARIITPMGARVVYTASGIDYAAINMLFSALSIEHFIQFIQKQETYAAKIGKGGFVLAFSLTQVGAILVTMLSTSTSQWEIFLGVGGALPGSLYGSTLIFEHQVPHWVSSIRFHLNKVWHPIHDCFHPISNEEKLYRQKVIHYDHQRKNIFEIAYKNWDFIARNSDKILYDKNENPMSYLFKHQNTPQQSYVEKIIHQLGNITGLGLGGLFAAPFVKNAYSGMKDYIPSIPLQIMAAGMLLSSQAYGNFKLTMDGVTGVVDLLYDVMRGKPINSLAFRTHPKATIVAGMISVIFATFSYSAMKMLLDSELPSDGSKEHKVYEIAAILGIDLYHLAGMMHLYGLALSHLSRDERFQFLTEVKRQQEHLTSMTREEFMVFVEKIEKETPGISQTYGIQLFAEPTANLKIEEITDLQTNEKSMVIVDIDKIREVKTENELSPKTVNSSLVDINEIEEVKEETKLVTETLPKGATPTWYGRFYNWMTTTHVENIEDVDNEYNNGYGLP